MRHILLVLFITTIASSIRANEGLWIPLLLNSLNEAEMQKMGMKMSAEDIYSVNHGSLKDAIVSFGGFCTGAVIGDQGLILTNHHCGYGSIQKHSTLEKNLLEEGVWASSPMDDLPNPGLFVTFIVRIEDVSSAVLNDVDNTMTPRERQSQIDRNIDALSSATSREPDQNIVVRPFFEGNQYFLFVTETYRDVRLVGAPPESLGKFGFSTDNWEWPRHTADFSMFRVYTDADNKPAEYSPDNVPMRPRHVLPVSLAGIEEGDFTMVIGFPGRTEQYLSSFGLKQVTETTIPTGIGIREISLDLMDKEMRSNPAARLKLAPRYQSLSNSYKKWLGQRDGLARAGAVSVKEELEEEFSMRLKKNPLLRKKYGDLLLLLDSLNAEITPLEKARIFYSEIFSANVRLFQLLSRLDQLGGIYLNNGSDEYRMALKRMDPWITDFYKDFEPSTDRYICKALLKYMSAELDEAYLPAELNSQDMFMHGVTHETLVYNIYSDELLSQERLNLWLNANDSIFFATLIALPAYQFYQAVQLKNKSDISSPYNAINSSLREAQRVWMAALMEVFPEKKYWPDANSTLRVSYGKVEGYSPRDAVQYTYMTTLDGMMEKYIPGDYEFDVHPKLIELYRKKDFGRYADPLTGKLPFCISGSNHTAGGNSGSPVIDASGRIIGLNFDRTWESTMSDYFYDADICRNIMVNIRFVLFVVEKFAGAGYLIDEMHVVTDRP